MGSLVKMVLRVLLLLGTMVGLNYSKMCGEICGAEPVLCCAPAFLSGSTRPLGRTSRLRDRDHITCGDICGDHRKCLYRCAVHGGVRVPEQKFLAGRRQTRPGWSIWGDGEWKIPDTDHDDIPGTGWVHYPKYGPPDLCRFKDDYLPEYMRCLIKSNKR